MSPFKGCVKELQNVLVDNFFSYESHSCYFLSHCHADHMGGLNQLLLNIHSRPNHYVYCSPISRLILLNKFGISHGKFIKELTCSEVVTVPESKTSPSYQVTVTPIPAGHCPGSIMFLFETENKTILYTGDFRIIETDTRKFKALHSNNQVKAIDRVYLDSTFLSEKYWNFPQRMEVISELVNIIKEWLSKGLDYNVLLQTSAQYGYEFVFVELARKLGCKIHVKDALYDLFWNVPDVGCELTKDCCTTNVHAFCSFDRKCSPCSKKSNLLTVKLSAQWYKSQKGDIKDSIKKDVTGQDIVACYSTHCSCSELVDFLNYLRPKSVKACTTAVGSTEEETKRYLRRIISSWSDGKEEGSPESCDEHDFPLQKNYKFKIKFPDREEDSFDDFWEVPSERKKRLIDDE